MIKYVLKRLIILIPVILGVAFIIFSIMALTPSSPGRLILGLKASEEAVMAKNVELGYDKPFVIRYLNFVKNGLKGDFGRSYMSDRPVFEELFARFPTTLKLAIFSILGAVIIGVPLGILSAVKQYSVLDLISSVTAMFLAAVPGFWLGLMFILVFSLQLGWFPVQGIGSPAHFVLPTLTLSLPYAATLLRITRSTMLETIRQDYVRTARAKGAKERDVIFRHALKNALLPLITTIGMHFGGLLGGTILTETVFGLPGIGTKTIIAIRNKDVPMITSAVVFLAALFCIIMLIVDLLYAYVDPRIKAIYQK